MTINHLMFFALLTMVFVVGISVGDSKRLTLTLQDCVGRAR